MTRRGLLGPLLATVATAACAPLAGPGGVTPASLGPSDWRTARAAYGADPRQTLSLHRPARARGLPILVLFPEDAPGEPDARTVRTLVEQGFVVVLADRRAAPGSPSAFIADAAAAVAWTTRRAEDLGGDARRLGLLGMGEGGRAALMLALDRRYLSAAGAPGAVRAAAALGAPDRPDATFTDPSAYGGASDAAPVWRGAAGDRAGAVAFLRGVLG